MEKKYDEIWAIPANSAHNAFQESRKNGEDNNEDEDDEALSLSDLPLLHQPRKDQKEEERESVSPHERETTNKPQEDFDFCSLSKESEMCAADEVFFQGQILPLSRHSVSSEKGYPQNARQSISRSESDHYRSAVGFLSSRSSSISSHQSSSSSSARSDATVRRPKPPPTARNQFHSHPSPSPRLHSNRPPTIIATNNHRRSVSSNKSSVWKVLRLGLVATPPEIAFQDLKTRGSNNGANCRNFGSRNSTSSNSSSGNSERKKKARGGGLLSGCKCSVDTVASRVVFMKRSGSESAFEVEKEKLEEAKQARMTTRKKVSSHHRTFEWLKQLSIEGAADG